MTQDALFAGRDVCGAWPFGDLRPYSFDLIFADCPWHFTTRSPKGGKKSPQAQYATMTLADIAALPVSDLAAEDCLLWLWGTAPLLDEQISIVKAWGFTFKSAGAWNKKRWGTGYLWRSKCEFILLGTRGKPKINGASIPNLIEECATVHSRKPDASYIVAEKMMPDARRVELFSRTDRPGWTTWGHEKGKLNNTRSDGHADTRAGTAESGRSGIGAAG